MFSQPILEFSSVLLGFKKEKVLNYKYIFCSITMLFWFSQMKSSTKSSFAFHDKQRDKIKSYILLKYTTKDRKIVLVLQLAADWLGSLEEEEEEEVVAGWCC